MAETGLTLEGTHESGQNVRAANVTAVCAVANILKTSLGPQGLDKMLVDDIGEVTISNDGATILKQLEVEHPAAKVLVELANLQDSEVGDGTTSVVIIAAELLRRANELVKQQIHPTVIIAGYRLAMKEAISYIMENLSITVDKVGESCIRNVAKTSLSSKLVGSDSGFFSDLVISAVKSIGKTQANGKKKYPISAINILKCHGKSSTESFVVDGYALAMGKASQSMVSTVDNAKIALLDFDLKKSKMGMNVNILVDDPAELEMIRKKEMDMTKDTIQKIIDAGANVIITSKGIDDMAMKYLIDKGVMGIRRVGKKDMRRLANCTKAAVQVSMATMEGDTEFLAENLGSCASVVEQKTGDNDFLFFKGCQEQEAKTIVLRGANEYMLEEMERSVHDAICAVSRTLESNTIVPGGGAVETALSLHLDDFARTYDGYEQWAVAQYAEALLTIPKTLAMNAALDSIDLLARLRAIHYKSQKDSPKEGDAEAENLKWYGLDLLNGECRDSLAAGVVEPLVSKLKSLKFATEAAITILRIDDLVKIAPEQEAEG
uniref:T-complex protein 1 subunit alpha n=1 Tax=Noctiluca scintillans TaxID=2966 RepID=A0A7S1A368_NOCSC|mmetsp:Transcript_28815/g.75947  ORF Transcript_28815/g.75947 Transcript_28815/m.75947 type:complete len:549 (+) Transcript_28815:57-1703(+)|eukprot:CAMPEP_0194503340 /NCGR_PEP_ID=MMETSP0253-20130528/28327_1 /TAXON_ID=2966 /ORGANISM="Noctiluca scintillans" /LENGTH=548 /DNA_ID=CAMNT_0039345617 /DNA_START=56 /DNA_END=1702 /DNA_ORIENTATION=-